MIEPAEKKPSFAPYVITGLLMPFVGTITALAAVMLSRGHRWAWRRSR